MIFFWILAILRKKESAKLCSCCSSCLFYFSGFRRQTPANLISLCGPVRKRPLAERAYLTRKVFKSKWSVFWLDAGDLIPFILSSERQGSAIHHPFTHGPVCLSKLCPNIACRPLSSNPVIGCLPRHSASPLRLHVLWSLSKKNLSQNPSQRCSVDCKLTNKNVLQISPFPKRNEAT